MRYRSVLILLALLAASCGGLTSIDDAQEATARDSTTEPAIPADPAPITGDAQSNTDAGGSASRTIDDLANELHETGFSGVVVIKTGGDASIFGFGKADRAAGLEFDESTVFDIGSITKQFTAAAILRLEMDGMLAVQDQLGDHVPYATGPLANVTLHQLLTHTAGLPGGMGDDYTPIDRQGIVALAATALTESTDEAPAVFNYSNIGYSMLGAVIEEVSGVSYEQYLRDVLFDPAGMQATGYLLPDWSQHVVAIGYDGDTAIGRPHELPWADDGPYWHLRANGGILSTANDMLAWNDALAGEEILDASAKAKFFGRHVPEGPDGGDWYYGYGWSNVALDNDKTLITHNGGNGIFFADLLRFVEDDVTIFVGTNTAGADEDVAYRIADVLLATQFTDGGPATQCSPDDVLALAQIDDFPATEAGDTVRAMYTAITTGSDDQRQAFARSHVPPHLAEGLTPAQMAAELGLIQQELAQYSLDGLRQDGEYSFSAVLIDDQLGVAVVSMSVDPAQPNDMACLDIEID